MCSINLVIGGSMDVVKSMHEATKHRGISESYRYFSVGHKGNRAAWVCYNHLPTTDESISGCGFETENYIVWLNGYISNHKELAEKYGLYRDTERDTEVLARMIEHTSNWLYELNGFFAILLYDKKSRSFHAYTDRYGAKQLYTYQDKNGVFYMSSELKGIKAICDLEINPAAVEDWHYSLGVMNEKTIYKNVLRVPKLAFKPIERSTDTSETAYKKAFSKMYALMCQSAQRNKSKFSDGVYLSGGIDSGIIAKYLDAKYSFSVDYVDNKYSEIELIKKNSNGHHMSLIFNKDMTGEYSYKTLQALDDLKAGSCFTNFAIAELASKFCRVVYSGAGGDEFFGGYPHRLKHKEIDDVICRNGEGPFSGPAYPTISHHEYDLKFLEAVLIVEDRMSGFHTMETRYPLLDNDLVDYARSLPLEFIENKRILKDISGLHDSVINGKKRGFSNPGFTNNEWTNFVIDNLK